jgi:hemolysin III
LDNDERLPSPNQPPLQLTAQSSVQSPAEELANALTHAAAAALAIAGFFALVVPAARSGDLSKATSLGVYSASLVLLYLISTSYHQCRPGKWKRALRIADHSAIYVLIAGTYTPFMVTFLKGYWGQSIMAALWTIAVLGTVLKVFFVGRFRLFSTLLYVAMGWTAAIAAKPISTHVPPGCVALLIAGGVAYTSGVIFYQWHRLRYHHAIWHLFVVAGSAIHFLAAWKYVLPAAR